MARYELVPVAKILSWRHLRFHLSRPEANFIQKVSENMDLSSVFAQENCDIYLSALYLKNHNSVNFYLIGPIFLHKVTDSEIYNFSSKVETRLCSNQYQFFIEERVRVDTGAQNKFVWAETSKFITNSLFIRLSRFSVRS